MFYQVMYVVSLRVKKSRQEVAIFWQEVQISDRIFTVGRKFLTGCTKFHFWPKIFSEWFLAPFFAFVPTRWFCDNFLDSPKFRGRGAIVFLPSLYLCYDPLNVSCFISIFKTLCWNEQSVTVSSRDVCMWWCL